MFDRRGIREAIFSRFYVVLMFIVISAIGSCAVYAMVISQRSGDRASDGYARSNEATLIALALDREQGELFSRVESSAVRMRRFTEADDAFDDTLAAFERDALGDLSDVVAMRPYHDAYARAGRAAIAALARGDAREAQSIETRAVGPNFVAARRMLNSISSASIAAAHREEARDRSVTIRLARVISCITIFALLLMSWFAVLLRRYKRSAVKAVEEKVAALQQAALTDSLTHLGNHRAFSDDFAREIARAERNHHALALALIDVDDFKAVNDSRGHGHGDDVLTAVGELLRTLRREDRAYRVGGDEFALLLVETDAASAKLVLSRLRHEAQARLSGATLSIGYVNLTEAQLDQEPYELADTALYEAKRGGRNTIVCFGDIGDAVNVFSPRKAELVRQMIGGELLSVAYQPIWDIDSTRPLAFEALARPAPELDLSGPQEAFDIAERIRQVYELDSLCIRKALEAVPNLPSGATIFLNLAPATLAHARFDPDAFVAQLRAANVDPRNVVIELTERRIDDQAAIIQRSHDLQALGVRMALDDTGSGHAGLEILSKLRLDFVKIDRSLLVKAIDDKGARGVLAGIIAIARETGSYLIAEGVESRALLDFACNAHDPGNAAAPGIRGVQGYLLGRPELGQVDLHALEGHSTFLATRSLEKATATERPKAAA
jgi:diguanylate cyclase (GGDEF)-like protein